MSRTSQFSQLSNYMRVYLTYSKITGHKATTKNIIEEIKSINLDEALLILAKFTMLNDESKKFIIDQLKDGFVDKEIIDITDAFDLSNILYAIKWYLAYGERNPFKSNKSPYPKFLQVFLTLLKISDYMEDSMNKKLDPQDIVIQSSLFLRSGEMDRALIRESEMFEKLAQKKELFKPKEYLDIQECFFQNNGFTIQQYVSSLFAINQPCIKPLGWQHLINDIEWALSKDNFFKKTGIKDIANRILNDLSVDPVTLKTWALNTLDNPYDYEQLLMHPIFKYNNFLYPFSPAHMNAAIFDGLCFKLNYYHRIAGQGFFNFFGRLFEKYISTTLETAVEKAKISGYQFIPEFKYGKQNKDSSDANVKLGSTLIIVEGKGGRIRRETKVYADEKSSMEDYKKYVINPILQANKSYIDISEQAPDKFKDIKKVFILSVSVQSFPRVPKYNELLYKEDFVSQLHPHIKGVDYIGLSELELFAYIINKLDIPLQKFLLNKKKLAEYIPYPNYFYNKYGEIRRTDYHDTVLKASTDRIRTSLNFL